MADQWWSADETVHTAEDVSTGVIIPKKGPTALELDAAARANAAAARDEARFARETVTPAGYGTIPAGYRLNASGGLEKIPGGPKDTGAEPNIAVEESVNRAISTADRLMAAPGLSAAVGSGFDPASFGSINPLTGKPFAGTKAADFTAELQSLKAQTFLPAIQAMKGMGQLSNAEGEALTKAIGALDTSMSEEAFKASLERIKSDLMRYQERITGKPNQPAPADQGVAISGEGETKVTPNDLQARDAMQAKWNAGGSPDEVEAVARSFGLTLTPEDKAKLESLPRGAPAVFKPSASGARTQVEQAIGQFAETPVGGTIAAYGVGSANALLSGGMDELAPLIGLDGAQVQAAKDMLREKSPVASFAGEVSGQVGQLALGGAGLKALGATTPKALTALEIAQGGAYGAGESNDNRLLGAAMGAGGAVVGQQIAKRILEPAVNAAVRKWAASKGLPEEEVITTLESMGSAPESAPQAEAPAMAPEAPPVAEVPPIAPEAPPVAELAPIAPEAPMPQAEAPPVPGEGIQDLAVIAKDASGWGLKANRAKRKLAAMAKVDPEAEAAAMRLGIELPTDIISDDVQLKSLTGLARSQVGSEAETSWKQLIGTLATKADEAFGALEASKDLSTASSDVLDRLTATADDLGKQANVLRKDVTDAIDVRAPVDASNLQNVLGNMVENFGGLAEAKQAFSGEEKKLLAMLGDGETAKTPTYARLNHMRDQIGEALYKNKGPWTDTSQANLKRYYAALAEDQLAHVESVGGKELADKMRGSNTLYKKMYDQREDMVSLFGKELSKSIASDIEGAITKGAKGNIETLNKVLSKIPEDMHKPILATALLTKSMSKTAAGDGAFSFSNFANMYRGLRENKQVYAKIAKAIGPEGTRVLSDLYAVSRRMAQADANVIKTGKANQAALNTMNAQSLMGKVANAVTGKVGASVVGGVTAGPLGAGAGVLAREMAEPIVNLMTGGKTGVDKVHNLIASPEFRGLVDELATGGNVEKAANKLATSKPFIMFGKGIPGLKTTEQRRAWINSALSTSAVADTTQPQAGTITVEVQ